MKSIKQQLIDDGHRVIGTWKEAPSFDYWNGIEKLNKQAHDVVFTVKTIACVASSFESESRAETGIDLLMMALDMMAKESRKSKCMTEAEADSFLEPLKSLLQEGFE